MDITIEVTEDLIVVEYEKITGSRRMWAAPGVDIYVKGKLNDGDYERVQHMAMTVCDEMHIPVSSMRKVDDRNTQPKKHIEPTQSKRMF